MSHGGRVGMDDGRNGEKDIQTPNTNSEDIRSSFTYHTPT